jgi:hypothetical protein
MATCTINPVIAETTNAAFSIAIQQLLDKNSAVDYKFSINKEVISFVITKEDGSEEDLSAQANSLYNYHLGEKNDKLVLPTQVKAVYGSKIPGSDVTVLDSNSLMKEFTNYIFNHVSYSGGAVTYKSKQFHKLTEFLANSNNSNIEIILNKFYSDSSSRGVLKQISDTYKDNPTEQQKQLDRVKQELKNRLAGYKISLTELEEELEITEEDRGNQDWRESNLQEPTSFADSLFRLYLSSILDQYDNPYEARVLQNRLLKSYASSSYQEIEDDLRRAYDNPTALNSFKVQIYKDLFLNEASITPNGKSKLSNIERLHRQIRTQTKLSFLTFVKKAVAQPTNIVVKADGTVIANDSVLETEYNIAMRNVQEILKTFVSGVTSNNSQTIFKSIGNSFALQESPLLAASFDNINVVAQFLYQTGLLNTIFGKDISKSEESFSDFISAISTKPENLEYFKKLLNALQGALLGVLSNKEKQNGNTIVDELFRPYGTHNIRTTNNIPVFKNLQTTYKNLIEFLHRYYEEYPRNNRYFKEGKGVYQISLTNTAHNNIEDLKKEFDTAESRVDPSLFLGKVLTHINFNDLSIVEVVQIEDEKTGQDSAFGFMSTDEFLHTIITELTHQNAVSSLRAADRGLQRAFKGLVTSEITPDKVYEILTDILRTEIATSVYFRTNETVFKLLEGTQYAENIRNLRLFKDIQDDGSQDITNNVNLDILSSEFTNSLDRLNLETYDDLKAALFEKVDQYLKFTDFKSYYDKLINDQLETFDETLSKLFFSGQDQIDKDTAVKYFSKAFVDQLPESNNLINRRDVAKKLALMYLPGTYMQQHIVFGDMANFKPDAVKKRIDGAFSTREATPQMGEEHYDTLNKLFPRMDGKSHSNEITDLVIGEPKKALSKDILPFYEESLRREAEVIYPDSKSAQANYVESKLEEAKNSGFIDIADATTWTSLDYFEQSMLNNSSLAYSEQHKAAVQYEKQLLAFSFLRHKFTYGQFGDSNQGQNALSEPLMTIAKFNTLFGMHLSSPLTQKQVDENNFNPQYEGKIIHPEDFAIGLSIKKDQGYTQVTAIFNPETNTHEREAFKHIGLMELFKTAPNVIIPSNTKGAFAANATEALKDPMYKLAAFMFAQQIDTVGPPSGRKFMKKSMNSDTGFSMQGNKVTFNVGGKIKHRQLSTRNLGKQLETGDFEKGVVTLSTQFRRLIGLDLTSYVDDEGRQQLYMNFDNISKKLNSASEKRFIQQLQKLGYDVKYENGKISYSINISDQETLINFIDKLAEQYQTRSVKVSVLEEFEALKTAVRNGLITFDFSLQRGTIENSISKKVKSSNNVKVAGEMYIQETGYLYNEDLKMYDVGDEDIIQLAEVIVPLPKKLVGYVDVQYQGRNFREKLDRFNEAIMTGTSKIDPNILEFMANRIPSQSAASVEAFKIKKFLMPHSGARIVLPLDFVFKSGSDFDVDKLTAYLNTIQFNKEGHPYVPYAKPAQFVDDVFRPEYFEELNLALKYGLSVAGVSDEEATTQIDSLFNDFNELIEKTKQNTDEIRETLKNNEAVYNKFTKLVEIEERKIAADKRYATTTERNNALNKVKPELILKAYEGTEIDKDAVALIRELEEDIIFSKGYLQKPTASRMANMREFDELKNRFKNILTYVKERVPNEVYKEFLTALVPTKIMDNVAMREIKQLFRHIENINLLYTPIAAPYLKHLATKELAAPVDAKDFATSFTLRDEILAFESFIGAAIPLGQAATANVLHALAQWYPIRLKKETDLSMGNLFENVSKDENGYFAVGNKLDGYGNPKSRIYNEQITGYVDVAKDPFIMRLLVHGKTYSKFLFMHEVYGIPMKQIVKTFALPVVYQMINGDASVVPYLIDKLQDIQQKLKDGPVTPKVTDEFLDKFYYFEGNANTENTVYNNEINYIDKFDVAQLVEMFTKKGITKNDIALLIKTINAVDELKLPAIQLKNMVEILRADSKFTNNRLEAAVLSAIRESFNDSDFSFESSDIQKLIDSTYLSKQIAHQYSLINGPFNEYGTGILSQFFITENPAFDSFKRPVIENIIYSGISSNDRVTSFARIEDTLLTYLVSSRVFNDEIEESFDDYLKDAGKVHNTLERLISIANGGSPVNNLEREFSNALKLLTGNELIKLRNFLSRFKPSITTFTMGNEDYTIKAINVINDKLSVSEEYDTLVDGFNLLKQIVGITDGFKTFPVDLIKHLLLQYGLINGPNPWKNNISPLFYMDLILGNKEVASLPTDNEVRKMFLRAVQANNGFNNNKSPDLSVLVLQQPRFKLASSQYGLTVKPASGNRVMTYDKQVTLPLTGAEVNDLTRLGRLRYVQFLTTLKTNPYIIVQTYRQLSSGSAVKSNSVVFAYAGNNGTNLVFNKLNTLGKYWNITLDKALVGLTRHGYVSNIGSNNIDSLDEMQKGAPIELGTANINDSINLALSVLTNQSIGVDFSQIRSAELINKTQTPATQPTTTGPVKPENISSRGSEFAKKLTNVGNMVGLLYKGKQYVNSEHAYQTWKSGEFNQAGYDLKGGKVRGGKIGDTFAIMTDIITEKLKQHPDLVQGINERGGLAYIEQSTHNVIGDKFWESTGQNKFIEALAQAYKNVQPTTTGNPQYPGLTEFNKLPAKSSTPTMTYAGIGSREAPTEVLEQMTEVAKYLEGIGYTLNTGKTYPAKPSSDPKYQAQYEERLAFSKKYNGKVGLDEEGADRAFSLGATKKNLFSPEKHGSRPREQAIAKEIHLNWSALVNKGPGGPKLMARNTNQIFGNNLDTPVDFVLFYAKETSNPLRPAGGTGQAVEMARRKGIPTINMADLNWRTQLDAVLSGLTTQQNDGTTPPNCKPS